MQVVEGFDDHEEDAMDTGALSLPPSRTPSPVSQLEATTETGTSEDRDREYGETEVSPVKLSSYDEEQIQAVRLCRAFVERGVASKGRMGKLARKLAKRMAIFDGKFVHDSGEVTLEVIEDSDRFMAVMREMHSRMGHRQFATIIHRFEGRFFTPSQQSSSRTIFAHVTNASSMLVTAPLPHLGTHQKPRTCSAIGV
jgi:hypothetical protein